MKSLNENQYGQILPILGDCQTETGREKSNVHILHITQNCVVSDTRMKMENLRML